MIYKMDGRPPHTLISLVGPTAVGKTAKAIPIAKALCCDIFSADSRQIYREMHIGTAKPDAEELAQVPHHFIDSHSIEDDFSAGDYESAVLNALKETFKTHAYALLVGGSGLFVQAALYGLDVLPKPAPGIREKLNESFKVYGLDPLRQRLKAVDPDYFSQVDIHNPQRVIRALEVFESSGIPYSEWRKKQMRPRDFNILNIGLEMDRSGLYAQINQRVDKMMQAGLLTEVRQLLSYQDTPPLKTVGYAELFDYLNGKCDLETAVEKIKQNTRRYAKRQMTWFKRDASIHWFNTDTAIEEILAFIGTHTQN